MSPPRSVIMNWIPRDWHSSGVMSRCCGLKCLPAVNTGRCSRSKRHSGAFSFEANSTLSVWILYISW